MSRKAPDPFTHARQTKGTTSKKRADWWAGSEQGLAYIRRIKKGQRVRSERFIEVVGKAVEQAFDVVKPASAMFKLREAVALLNEIEETALPKTRFPQDDEVLALLDELGNRSRVFVQKCAALRAEARALAGDLMEIDTFLKANRVLLNSRRQLGSEQQVIAIYINRVEKMLGIEQARVEPKELETMVQLTAIHQGLDLADAPASLQEMAERWRTMNKKVRRGLALKLEKALARSKQQKPTP